MENKTAVEWLIEQIKDDQFKKVKTDLQWSKIFEQAKEMEKQQIMDATCFGEYINDDKEIAERYYNETYK
jgi:hypothetical protein